MKKNLKRIVALDFGLKRIGLAISDENKILALPWTTLTGGLPSVIKALSLRKQEIESIVIGLPLLMNGKKGEMALMVETFAKALEEAVQIPIILLDERLSSKQADSHLRETGQNRKKRSENTDQVAAMIMLESHLRTTRLRDPSLLPLTEAEKGREKFFSQTF